MTAARILVVDDEPEIRRFLQIGLDSHRYATIEAETGGEAIRIAVVEKPELMVLDLGLPDILGYEVIRRTRQWSSMPIIVLSVRRDEAEKVAAFDAGASDYVTKPFGMAELLARIRAHLRVRAGGAEDSPVVRVGELEMDLSAHKVTLRGERISLTPKEFQLLRTLMQHSGKVVTHRQLMSELWGEHAIEDNQYLRIYIRQLRRKIERDRLRDQYIHNELGIGYRLEYVER